MHACMHASSPPLSNSAAIISLNPQSYFYTTLLFPILLSSHSTAPQKATKECASQMQIKFGVNTISYLGTHPCFHEYLGCSATLSASVARLVVFDSYHCGVRSRGAVRRNGGTHGI